MPLPAAETSSTEPAASSEGAASVPASAKSQRGNPPENRRGTLPPLGAVAGTLLAARGAISSTPVRSSRISCSTLGAAAGATAGLLRYFANDSPGRTISSSVALVAEGAKARGASGRRLSKLRGGPPRFSYPRDSPPWGEAYFEGGRLRAPGPPWGRPPRGRPPRRPHRPPRPRSPPRSLPRSPPLPKFCAGRSLPPREG
jgi:hypothetical protein